jgi:hypothetical protein
MDGTLTDQQICELWAEHYPKRLAATRSTALCVTFCQMAESRAQQIKVYDEWSDKLDFALTALGIPRHEYNQIKSEQSE